MSQRDTEKDYYSILGVEATASQDEIERRFKRLALRHHPDRGGDAEEMKGNKRSLSRAVLLRLVSLIRLKPLELLNLS